MTGILGKTALSRKDFDRTNNPIYSFAVTGKYKNYLLKLEHQDCFGNKSPFDFLYKKNAKYLSIDINFRDYGFTPIHYAEQKANASYRFIKTLEGYCTFKSQKKVKKKYKFFARYLDQSTRTGIRKIAEQAMTEKQIIDYTYFENVELCTIDIKKAIDIFYQDLMKKKPKFVFPMTNNFKRNKVNNIKILD